jgi:hypothetical protein
LRKAARQGDSHPASLLPNALPERVGIFKIPNVASENPRVRFLPAKISGAPSFHGFADLTDVLLLGDGTITVGVPVRLFLFSLDLVFERPHALLQGELAVLVGMDQGSPMNTNAPQ